MKRGLNHGIMHSNLVKLALGLLWLTAGSLPVAAQAPASTSPAGPAATNRNENASELSLLFISLDHAVEKKDWDQVAAKLAQAEKLLPTTTNTLTAMGLIRFKLLLGRKEYPAAYQLADRLGDTYPNDEKLNNDMAWEIATADGVERRDLALADKLAVRAQAASQDKQPLIRCGVLDTLARVRFLRGKPAEAAAFEEQAVQLAQGDLKPAMQKNLEAYRKAAAERK